MIGKFRFASTGYDPVLGRAVKDPTLEPAAEAHRATARHMLRHPLPWTWEEHELSDGHSCIVYDARGERVGGFDHLDHETADLIVRAVNDYDELVAALQAHDEYMRDLGFASPEVGELTPKAAENWRRIRAALACAEGRQP